MPESDYAAGTGRERCSARYGVLDAIVDQELIGDYAYEIVLLSASMAF